MVTNQFSGLSLSVTAFTHIVKEIFPNVSVKRLGKKRTSCIGGIKLRTPDSGPAALTSASPSSPTMATSSSSQPGHDVTTLMMELQRERQRRIALEGEVEELRQTCPSQKYAMSAADYQQGLCLEVLSVSQSQHMLFHGPDTVQQFGEFSMGGLIDELKSSCPELYKLMQELGRTQRNAVADSIPNEELKNCHGNLHSSQCPITKGKGLAIDDEPDASS